jgi:oligopeptide/dipeptide ABC transporter, ATP-binding protein, C-terminal domain
MEEKEKILEVSHLKKYFKTGRGTLKAVDDVSFFIRKGETLGIVGESGCGKTTCGRTCIGIHNKTDGHVLYKGKDVHSLRGKERKEFTKEVQIIFQDPYSSLDPKMKVGDIIAEGLKAHHMCKSREEEQARVKELLETVGLNAEHATRYVHEFSGGQRQRIGIARALAVEPEVLLMDEPTSALDPISTLKIEELMNDLKKRYTVVVVTHNMQQAARVSDETAFFLLGELVEADETMNIFGHPKDKRTEDYITGRFG